MNRYRHVAPITVVGMRNHLLGEAPWVMRMRWLDLLFAHWPLPVEALRQLVDGVMREASPAALAAGLLEDETLHKSRQGPEKSRGLVDLFKKSRLRFFGYDECVD